MFTRNDAEGLARLLGEARNSRLFNEILVVDDASDPPARAPGARLIRQEQHFGIGAARNTAIAAARCHWLVFVDSDDRLLPELSALVADLAEHDGPFDLCLFRHIDSRSAARGRAGQTEADERLWQQAGHSVGALSPARPGALPVLAQTTNYPWNKIFRTGFLRTAGIRCPETAVHEDMALHWLSLARAGRVLVSDRACLWHEVRPGGNRLTNRPDGVRMQLFPALDAVAEGLRDAGPQWRAAFLTYALTLADWAEGTLHEAQRPRFRAAAARWFAGFATRNGEGEGEIADRLAARIALAAPETTGRARIRLALCGPHAIRSPFRYPALQPLWRDRIHLVAGTDGADLALCAHPRDAADLPPSDSGLPLALFSEEPFWDSLFSPDPLAGTVEIASRALHQVNHHGSPVFTFDRIPYFLLTDHGFAAAYAHAFARNARKTAQDWLEEWSYRRRRAVFMAERRPEAFHDLAFPEGDMFGLCAWRTHLALAVRDATRMGASWEGGPSRLDLPDWHMDKLVRLDGTALMISAIENTHQPAYLSEKLFDAFACGAVPIALASPGHRLHRLGLPEGAWINLHGAEVEEAATRIDAWQATPGMAADYTRAQAQLAELFGDTRTWVAERQRLARAVLAEVERLVETGPARLPIRQSPPTPAHHAA